jgi:uncharacterized protein
MLLQVDDFCRRVSEEMEELVLELQDETGREGEEEAYAWRSSLPRLAEALSHESLAKLHMHFARRGSLEIEYRLPSSGAWCDAVLLGQGHLGPSALVVELKHWVTGSDRPGPSETLVHHNGELVLHPSDQVRGYVEYCRRFHSAVQEHQANVDGCVMFTRTTQLSAYLQKPHADLVSGYPVFGASEPDLRGRFPDYVLGRLSEPNERFANDFSNGVYRQDRRFVRHVSSLLRDPTTSPFVLLDEQRRGFDVAMHEIEKHLHARTAGERLVVVVEGPPGSGKSVLAAQLWASLACHPSIDGNVVFSTTSGCQRSNWEALFKEVASNAAGAGLVVPANTFNPGLRPAWINEQRQRGHAMKVADWQENLEVYRASGKKWQSPDLQHEVAVVDEAHALIDPTAHNAEGVPPSGWSMHAGPQAYHIMRSSSISVFLMDSEQSYRDNETTSPDGLIGIAALLPETRIIRVSLHGAQFRCGGSKAYTDWVDNVLQVGHPSSVTNDWRRCSENLNGQFEFEILPTPEALEGALRARERQGESVRFAASYARKWRTQKEPDPHGLPPHAKDFCIDWQHNGSEGQWSKIWNHAPAEDYTRFVQGRAGTPIGNDPLCEVGCPYVLRGFDFDYIGLLWMSDLVRRDGEWRCNLEHIHETAWKKSKAAARRGGPGSTAMAALTRRLQRGYRILLTRAIKGMYLWCEDEETRQYLEGQLALAR